MSDEEKRFVIALVALHAMIAIVGASREEKAKSAVDWADALLAALKAKPNG